MSRVDYGELAHLKTLWRNNPMIPEWKKEGMVILLDTFLKKVADNNNEIDGVQLYFPQDCHEYDVFMSVVNALDALVIPTSGDCLVASHFGKYSEFE